MLVRLITVGALKEVYLRECAEEYKKRISAYAKIEEINLKEELIKNEDNEKEVQSALDCEGDRILSYLKDGSYTVALCVEGKQFSSPELANIVKRVCDASGKLTLIIGSSHGLSEKVKNRCDLKLSFSKLTFPHQLMRVILLEALYRSFTIIAGKKYHK